MPPPPLGYLDGGLVGLEEQGGPRLQEGPQLDLVLPADGELAVPQGEDLIDGPFSDEEVLQLLWMEGTKTRDARQETGRIWSEQQCGCCRPGGLSVSLN